MTSSLEEHYLNILGNPEEGNLPELEKKFKRLSAEYLITKTADRVDISMIQRSGELTSAYLYLKSKWEKQTRSSPFVPKILRIEHPEQPPLTFLEKLHKELYGLAMAGLFFVAILSLYQLGVSLLDNSFASAFSGVGKQNMITEYINSETTINAIKSQNSAVALRKNRETFLKKIDSKQALPIQIAAKSCDLQGIKSLISNQANLNSLDELGATPLHWTSRINCISCSQALIAANASINIKDYSGKTALDWAKLSNNHESIRLLEKFGAQ